MIKLQARWLMLFLILLIWTSSCFAQAAGEGTIQDNYSGIAVEKWVGKSFIVLPLEQSEREKGYPFILVNPSPALTAAGGNNVRADWLQGKELVVLAVAQQPMLKDYNPVVDYLVTFREVGSGQILKVMAMGGQAPQLVIKDDLINARKHFLGTTVYSKRLMISTYSTELSMIHVKVDEPLSVIDVVPGVTANEPIWLVVKTADQKVGYIAINYSNTNVYQGIWVKGNPWARAVMEQNPRSLYNWEADIWASINSGVIKLGMLPDQVRFIWDEPQAITVDSKTGDQIWSYPGKLLKFNLAGLYSIEDR